MDLGLGLSAGAQILDHEYTKGIEGAKHEAGANASRSADTREKRPGRPASRKPAGSLT